jgi:hypothetical protein
MVQPGSNFINLFLGWRSNQSGVFIVQENPSFTHFLCYEQLWYTTKHALKGDSLKVSKSKDIPVPGHGGP